MLRRIMISPLLRDVNKCAPADGKAPGGLPSLNSAGRRGGNAMARTYREIAIEEMLRTVEEAMSQVINWWGDLPPPMKEAIEQFRTQLGAAIDSVEFVKRALDREVHETDRGKRPTLMLAAVHESG
jgi:hypothetical protein